MAGSHAFYAWIVEHKEGLPVLAALIAAFAASVSPFIQREIAERTLNFQRKQAAATLYGAYNQRWVDKFSEKSAEFIANAIEIQAIRILKEQQKGDVLPQLAEKLVDRLLRNGVLGIEISMMLENNNLSKDFSRSVIELTNISTQDANKLEDAQHLSIKLAQTIVRNRLNDVRTMLK